jgi:hypothetical protein
MAPSYVGRVAPAQASVLAARWWAWHVRWGLYVWSVGSPGG